MLRNIPKEYRPCIFRGGSLKSHTCFTSSPLPVKIISAYEFLMSLLHVLAIPYNG